MDFRVLGQIEAVSARGDVALGSFKQRSLLALLLIHANQVVSTDRIIDELWGDEPAPTARTRSGCTSRTCAPRSSRTGASGPRARCS